jgi:hypothetical protein
MPISVHLNNERSLIDNFGLNAGNAGFWANAHGGTMDPAPSATAFQQAAAQHQADLFLYAYTADEIGSNSAYYEPMKQWARNMHTSRIKNLVTMTPVYELADDGGGTGKSAVDIWVMLPKMYNSNPMAVAYMIQKGDEAWSYNCLLQEEYSPKWLLDFLPINYRIQPGFINKSLGLTGLLYWRVDDWSADPWNNVEKYGASKPGEGMLVYPGAQVGLSGYVMPSMRLKWLRDGVDDYDYIQILKELGREDWALELVRTVGADWVNWSKDANALESVRRQLGEEINRLSTN